MSASSAWVIPISDRKNLISLPLIIETRARKLRKDDEAVYIEEVKSVAFAS